MSRTAQPARRHHVSARDVAVTVLARVERQDAFANLLLHHAIADARLSPADAALATELVLGVLRFRSRLDWTLDGAVTQPLSELPVRIQAILRTGVYQLLFLARVPARAAVHEAVELAKRYGHAGTAGLVNAVLRRVASAGERALPPASDPVGRLAVEHSHPRWLVQRWVNRLGHGDAAALCAANNQPAPLYGRLNLLRGTPEALVARLRNAGVVVTPTPLTEGIELRGEFAERQRMAEEGLLTIQDLGAMLVSHVLDPQPGETVIDACAAPGGKTTHIAERMADRGRLIACDVHGGKLAAAPRRAAAMGITILEPQVQDARRLGEVFPAVADRVLVDAPCTGLGVVRRRPEIKWRVREKELPGMAALQQSILSGAAGTVRSGGILVYSVCTTEPEEGEGVIAGFLAARPDFSLESVPSLPAPFVPTAKADSGMMSVWPHRHGTDGFYIARLRRTGTVP